MAAKIFEVNDELPATTRLRISWTVDETTLDLYYSSYGEWYIRTTVSPQYFLIDAPSVGTSTYVTIAGVNICEFDNDNNTFVGWKTPYTAPSGDHAYIDIDTSSWSLEKRTVTKAYEYHGESSWFLWEDLNAPSGYTITFNSNGGTTISDIEEATELPTLPIPTRSGYTFVNWYYDSAFTQKAKAGDTIESNVTLYAKWHNLGSLFTEIADAIRSKDGTSEDIRDVDFGERIKQIQVQGAKEEETKTVTPNFSSGNVVVTPTSGKVMTQVTINKDSNLIADNIKKDITVHGITGTLQPAKEEETKTVTPNFSSGNVVVTPTTSSQDVLPDANKVLSKVTVNAIPTETKSQQPNLSSGDQTINATSGKFMTSFTITKDTTNHIASNIRSGKTLYGVTGNLQPAKEEETKTVTPNFSSGNQVINPTSGKVLSQVTLTKPSDLIPKNIAKDKNVCGVVGTSFIAIELTQAEYDALGTKDANTYYLIVEVE
jgi:uncharacterized repeat protein (TIGR02543 family)